MKRKATPVPQTYRQGDVLLLRCADIPTDAVAEPVNDNRVVLAYGEVTGHAHAIDAKQAKSFSFAAERFLQVQVQAMLKHEEHATIELPAGNYRIVQQREYSPEEIRNVAD